MTKYNKLFEFTHKLINVQIVKYTKLAAFGVGPDARMNASLVLDGVNELIDLSRRLLTPASVDEVNFKSIFNQVRFYVEQEKLRAHAGWLLDQNNIHRVFTLERRATKFS